MDLVLLHAFGYGNTPLHSIDDHTIMHSCGNVLKFASTLTTSQHFLMRPKARVILATAFNSKTARIAVIAQGETSEVIVYSYPEKKLLASLVWPDNTRCDDESNGECCSLRFSDCGNRLAALRYAGYSVENKELCIWDMITCKALNGCCNRLVKSCCDFSFNPADANQIVFAGCLGLQFWQYYCVNRQYYFIEDSANLIPDDTEATLYFSDAESNSHPEKNICSHCWLPHGHVLIGNSVGNLLLVDTCNLQISSQIVTAATRENHEPIISIVLMAKSILLTYVDGALYWLSASDFELIQVAKVPVEVLTVETSRHLSQLNAIASVAPGSDQQSICIGTKDGRLHRVKAIIGNRLEDDEGSPEMPNDALEIAQQENEGIDSDTIITSFGTFHIGAVLSTSIFTPLGGTRLQDLTCVTGGSNGQLFFWNLFKQRFAMRIDLGSLRFSTNVEVEGENNEQAAIQTTPASETIITSMDSRENDSLLLVGSQIGLLRILCIEKNAAHMADPISDMSVHSLFEDQLFSSKSAIDLIKIHPVSPLALIASTSDAAVYLNSLNKNTGFSVLAYWIIPREPKSDTIQATCLDVQWTTCHSLSMTYVEFLCYTSEGGLWKCRYYLDTNNDCDLTELEQGRNSWVSPIQLDGIQLATLKSSCPGDGQEEGTGSSTMCMILQPLGTTTDNVMLGVAPWSNDIYLWQHHAGENSHEYSAAAEDNKATGRLFMKNAHDMGITAVALYPLAPCADDDEELVATGSSNGTITLWTITAPATKTSGEDGAHDSGLERFCISKRKSIVPHAGPVTYLKFIHTTQGLKLVSAGDDGNIFVMIARVPHSTHSQLQLEEDDTPAVFSAEDLNLALNRLRQRKSSNTSDMLYLSILTSKKNNSNDQFETFYEKIQNEQIQAEARRDDPIKNQTRISLSGLKTQLQALLTHNNSLSQVEQLEMKEFVINLNWRDYMAREHELESSRIRDDIYADVIKAEIAYERMKQEFWDKNRVQGAKLRSLLPPNILAVLDASVNSMDRRSMVTKYVYNFPVRRWTEKANNYAKKLYLMRLIELEHGKYEQESMKDIRRSQTPQRSERCDYSNSFFYRCGAILKNENQWLVLGGMHHPLLDQHLHSSSKMKSELSKEAASSDGDLAVDMTDESNLNDALISGSSDTKYRQDVAAYILARTNHLLDVSRSFVLVYHPMTMRSRRQQRLQMFLLKHYETLLIDSYNRNYQELVYMKDSKMNEIDRKHSQIKGISEELGIEAIELDVKELARLDAPENIFKNTHGRKACVESSNIKNSRIKREHDEVFVRALDDMMDGTLEVKKESLLMQKELMKDSWMLEISPEDMNAEQRKQVANMEAAQKKLLEDREKYRKSLELELRKLRLEILDIAQSFDRRVGTMQDTYNKTRELVFIQHLYILHLTSAIAKHGFFLEEQKMRRETALCSQTRMEKVQSQYDQFVQSSKSLHETHAHCIENDKCLERNFMKDFEALIAPSVTVSVINANSVVDQDSMKIITGLYKKRKPDQDLVSVCASEQSLSSLAQPRSSVKQNTMLRSLHAITNTAREKLTDPLDVSVSPAVDTEASRNYQSELELVRCGQYKVVPLHFDTDCPVGYNITDRMWRALNELREKKIISELIVQKVSDKSSLAKFLAEKLHQYWQETVLAYQTSMVRLKVTEENMNLIQENAPILALIKQGQDESQQSSYLSSECVTYNQARICSNSNEAMLVERERVEALNEMIQVHGSEQYTTLSRIKAFRKYINRMEWEHTHLQIQQREMEERYTDLQLLRVTKELQELLQTGSAKEKQRRQLQTLKARLNHLAVHHHQCKLKEDDLNQHLDNQLKRREQENERFKSQIHDLELQVQVRQNILTSRQCAGDSKASCDEERESDTSLRSKCVTIRKKLVELIKTQTNDIEYLRSELDRLRRKTFPMLASQNARKLLPDYKW